MENLQSLTSLRVALFTALGMIVGGCESSVDVVATSDSAGATGGSSGDACTETSGSYGDAPPGAACEGAQAILTPDGVYSGFARCPDGSIHRIEVVACNPSACVKPCAGAEPNIQCETDAECSARPYGKCGSFAPGANDVLGDACRCVYSCMSDADCDAGSVCVCAGVIGNDESGSVCVRAGCTTGQDCASRECGLSTADDGCGVTPVMGCRTESDGCRFSSDCQGLACLPTEADGWQCTATPVCGRPLLVGGESRTAPPRRRGDWARAGASPDVNGLDPALRAALAAHWQDVAALEHASIASFARFTLQLLALGAPPDLLADAQRAAADEVEHARMAYSVASAYAGRPIGPAALDVACLPVASELGDVLCALAFEACVGETLGAAEAAILAEVVVDPALRAVQARIAEEELRHAALAWRTLQWGLAEASADTRRRVAEAFERAMAAAARGLAPRERAAREHGLLSSEEIGAIRRQALRDVVVPCARALVDVRSSSGGGGLS